MMTSTPQLMLIVDNSTNTNVKKIVSPLKCVLYLKIFYEGNILPILYVFVSQ